MKLPAALPQRPGNGYNSYVQSAGTLQHHGTFLDRAAGSQNIIHQQYTAAPYPLGIQN
jgi:hypothetical protein